MRLILASLCLALAANPAAADMFSSLGVFSGWDIQKTKEEFARAGIKESTDEYILWYSSAHAQFFADETKQRFFADEPAVRIPKAECLNYENALKRRDDLRGVSICFFEKKHQYYLVGYFANDKIRVEAIRKLLTETYGEPMPGEPDIWTEKPAIYGYLLTTKHISLYPLSKMDSDAPRRHNICAAVMYLNSPEMIEYVDEKKEALEKAREEQSKEDREGL